MKDINGKEIIVNQSVVKVNVRQAFYLVVGIRINEIGREQVLLYSVKKQTGYPSAVVRTKFWADVQIQGVEVVGLTPRSADPLNAIKIEEISNFLVTDAIVEEFKNLRNSYSPENITADGELSSSKVAIRRRELDRKWSLLEAYIQRKVSKEY